MAIVLAVLSLTNIVFREQTGSSYPSRAVT